MKDKFDFDAFDKRMQTTLADHDAWIAAFKQRIADDKARYLAGLSGFERMAVAQKMKDVT